MFWGLNLKANRKYSQTTNKSFHISQAALDAETAAAGGSNKIYVTCENQKFLICTLRKDSCEQVPLNLNFTVGNEICFQSVGSGNVTLSGYLIEDDLLSDIDDEDEGEDEDIDESMDLKDDLRLALKAKKNKAKVDLPTKSLKSGKMANKANGGIPVGGDDDNDEDDFYSDEDDEDFAVDSMLEELGEDEDDDDDLDDDDGDNDDFEEEEEDNSLVKPEEESDDDDEVAQPKAKMAKLDKQASKVNGPGKEAAAAAAAAADAAAQKKPKKNKKNKKEKAEGGSGSGKTAEPMERTLSGGVKITDMHVGNGQEAKPGKRLQVYYEGRLMSNNKVFDSLKTGAGFKFSMGRSEVIKGWDVGITGMKVGGKRRLVCPPHMAYGARGSPPTIPPNSTLVFDIELKAVH